MMYPQALTLFGNPRTSDEGVVLNALNANILPGYATSYKPYEISMALDAVTDALKNTDLSTRSVYPERNAPYKFNKNEIDYVLTANERQEYQKLYGQTYNQEVLNLINNKTQYDSKYFKSMTTEEKAEALFDIKSLATDTAKRALVEGKGNMYLNKDEAEKVQSYVSVGLSESKAYSLHNAIQALEPEEGSDSVSTYQKVSTVLKQQMTQGQKVNIVASYFTEHNKDGVVTSESLLPKLTTPTD